MRAARAPVLVCLCLALAATPNAGQGQVVPLGASACDAYAGCALRVQHGLFSTRIVRGTDDTEMAKLGFGAPPLDDLFASSAEAAISFQRFRTAHVRSSWMGLLGGIGFVGGLVAGARGHHDWAAGLSLSGTAFSFGSGAFRTRANEHLSRAVWWHNATLADAMTPAATPWAPPHSAGPSWPRSTPPGG